MIIIPLSGILSPYRTKRLQKGAFTLVELIVVITILAILGTIAFISLQGYSRDARDSTRTADLNNIKTSLELYSLKTGKYPKPDSFSTITYSGGIEDVWFQGIVGDQVTTNLKSLNEKPLDPLTSVPYTYSVTNSYKEYEVLALYEGSVAYNQSPLSISPGGREVASIISQANAAVSSLTPKIVGNYNGVFVKTTNYIIPVPSIVTSETITPGSGTPLTSSSIKSLVMTNGKNIPKNTLTPTKTGALNIKLSVYTGSITKISGTGAMITAMQQIQKAYSGTTLKTNTTYSYILNQTTNDQLIALGNITILKGGEPLVVNNTIVTTISSPITSTDCINVGWMWVDSTKDVYIGTAKGNGFCISPRFGDWQTNGIDLNDGAGGISWNGWGNVVFGGGYDVYEGWNASSTTDSGNYFSGYGSTRNLDSEVSYDCKSLGTAISDFDTTDTLMGRMKWLATTGNSYIQARNIDWITGLVPHTVGTYPQAIPALYIADCIDGIKDLGTTMVYTDTGSITENITYAQYNVNKTDSNQAGTYVGCHANGPSLGGANKSNMECEIYQNRQKYLTAWTQKPGSHLPSAFSYILNWTPGSGKGEYQVACELGLNINGEGTDILTNESIWLSALGRTNGTYWGRMARVIGGSCTTVGANDTTMRGAGSSARFIVRP